jgi:hypothetical protein
VAIQEVVFLCVLLRVGLLNWGTLDWWSDVTAGRVLSREENVLLDCALVLLNGLGRARPRRFLRIGQ